MSSLIDVSFLLLIYFIASSTLHPKEADLAVTLPYPSSEFRGVDIDPMQIRLTGQGSVIVNDEVLDTDVHSRSLPLLKNTLLQYKAVAELTANQTVIILDAEDSAKGQRFVDVLNTIAEVEIDDVTLRGFQTS